MLDNNTSKQSDRELLELAAAVGGYSHLGYVENEYRNGHKVTGHDGDPYAATRRAERLTGVHMPDSCRGRPHADEGWNGRVVCCGGAV